MRPSADVVDGAHCPQLVRTVSRPAEKENQAGKSAASKPGQVSAAGCQKTNRKDNAKCAKAPCFIEQRPPGKEFVSAKIPLSARIPSFGKSLASFRILLPGESLVLARRPPPICESLALRQKPRPGEASPPCENAVKEDATHSKKRTEDCYSTGRLLRRGFCLGAETALGTRLVRPRTFRSRRSRPDKGFAAPR